MFVPPNFTWALFLFFPGESLEELETMLVQNLGDKQRALWERSMSLVLLALSVDLSSWWRANVRNLSFLFKVEIYQLVCEILVFDFLTDATPQFLWKLSTPFILFCYSGSKFVFPFNTASITKLFWWSVCFPLNHFAHFFGMFWHFHYQFSHLAQLILFSHKNSQINSLHNFC